MTATNRQHASVQQLECRRLMSSYSSTDMGSAQAPPLPTPENLGQIAAVNGSYMCGTIGADDATQEAYISAVGKPKRSLLKPLSGYADSAALALTSSGVVVGYSFNGEDSSPEATEWKKGKAYKLGSGYADGINSSGEIVGASYKDGNVIAAAFGKHITFLGTLGGPDSYATGINKTGDIVGAAMVANDGGTQPFEYRKGKLTSLDTKTDLGVANAINDSGEIVGQVSLEPVAFVSGKVKTLKNTGGTGEALGINNAGAIVGDTSYYGATKWSSYTASSANLNKDISNNNTATGWLLAVASSIDNSGNIVGYGWLKSQSHAFLLKP